MVRATIWEKGINDILWPEVILTMTHIKNLRPTQALKRSISTAEMQNNSKVFSKLYHLYIFGSTVYIFFYKEKYTLKSAKWDTRAFKRKLVGYNGHTIYKIYIKEQNKLLE